MKKYLLYTAAIITVICFVEMASAQTETPSTGKLSINVIPSAWFDPWDGSCARFGVEFKVAKDISCSLDGGKYFHEQPKWTLKQNINGFEIRPMLKQYFKIDRRYHKDKHKAYLNGYKGDYGAVELIFKHQIFQYEDSIQITNGPRYDKWYSINRYVAGATLIYGEDIAFKKLIVGYYVGLGIRYRHSTSNLSDVEKNGLLTGEGHGDLIGFYERSTGNQVLPILTLGLKIGMSIL